MYNLHSHSLLSDGVLLPSEIAMRYLNAGYKAIAITDHADYSNIDLVLDSIVKFTRHWPRSMPIQVLPGVELTHLPLEHFKPLAAYARRKGAKVIIAHGQTSVEPVFKGTNLAALEADIDILAHPGLITDAEVKLAVKKGIFLEITSRHGHDANNAHVARIARDQGARIILNNDSHAPEDIISPQQLSEVGLRAGLSAEDLSRIFDDVAGFVKKAGK